MIGLQRRKRRRKRKIGSGELVAARKLAEEAKHDVMRRREPDGAETRAEEGIKSAGRLRKRLRVSISLGAAAIVAAIIASGAAWYADNQRKNSLSRELSTDAYSQISIDPDLSVRLSLEAISCLYTAEAERALGFDGCLS